MANRSGISQGFLTRLSRHQGGNTLAIVAAAIFPMLGLIGGGIDMSRIYLVKARLQQACDAGALAGRKQMSGGSWSANSYKARTTAENMFKANFQQSAYGTTGGTPTFVENSGKVTGTASAQVPMTIMKVFGQESRTISVTCDAEMRIPNTDVMFVLDVTGSMAQTNTGDTDTKINGLKKAVKCFYEALAKIDISNANCGSTPSGGNSASVQLRFGFVPYATNVNVGHLLLNDWMADQWIYQSREAQYTLQDVVTGYAQGTPTVYNTSEDSSGSWSGYSTYSDNTFTGVANRDACDDLASQQPQYISNGAEGAPYNESSWSSGSNQIVRWYTDQPADRYQYRRNSYSNGTNTCVLERRRRNAEITREYRRTDTPTYGQEYAFSNWIYKPVAWTVSSLKNGGSSWNSTVTLPIGSSGSNTTLSWDGCIEERQTWRNTDGDPSDDYDPIPTSAFDLDIDMVPSTGDPATQWGPALPYAVWGRETSGNNTYANVTTSSNSMPRNWSYSCPTAASKLTEYATSAGFRDYVDGLSTGGNTYHDIGLIWGARLMSPTGLFASENAFTPEGGQIERHMIFMTDGDTVTSTTNLAAYGLAWWDRRQTTTASAPTTTLLDNTVNARTEALCTAIRNQNITLWVISFGSGVSSAAQTRLQNCASPGRYYSAADSATLIANFKSIANEISQLRLTK